MSKVDIKSVDSQNEPDSFQKEPDIKTEPNSQNESKIQNEPNSLNNQDDDNSITMDSEKKGTEIKTEKEPIPNKIVSVPKNMCEWVAVVQDEGDEAIEIPTESDGTILISSLTAQFPGVIGLKFRNPETNTLRGIRCSDKQLYPPNQQADSALWGKLTYICTRAKTPARPPASKNTKDESKLKRKYDQDSDEMSSKNQRVDNFGEVSDESITSDLIVLGLSFKATTSDIREYFGTFGPLELAELKTEDTGQIRRSKGFAFIKFKDLEAQEKVLLTRHSILDRWCDVKLSEKAQKRKFQHESDEMFSKNQRVDDFDGEDSDESDTCDLIVLGLSFKATANDIREYFETYGPLDLVELKTKDSGQVRQSKGFAFIKFKDLEAQEKVLLTRHMILDRWCDVKVTEKNEKKKAKVAASSKIFVARLSATITTEDLKEHFEKFGPVTDVFIPKPFRSFGFVTFQESKTAQSLFGKDHLIKGVRVQIGSAQPRMKQNQDHGGHGGGHTGGHTGGHYGGRGNYGYAPDPWQSGSQGSGRGVPSRHYY